MTAFLTFLAFLWYFPTQSQWFEARRAESFQRLAGAKTPGELQVAVGKLGIVFVIRDHDWIAIRYVDTHAGRIWSSAVARDSGGAWYVSDVHFCGRFEMYRIFKENGRDLPEGLQELRSIEDAKDLETARELLIKLGFQRVPAPK